jgi:hypothetical protein
MWGAMVMGSLTAVMFVSVQVIRGQEDVKKSIRQSLIRHLGAVFFKAEIAPRF